MAEMTFEIKNLDGNAFVPRDIISYEWTRDADAACDGLRLEFLSGAYLGEAVEVKAYCEEACVFFGYVDYQSDDGKRAFIYARSSACLLVDNEAEQITLKSPCVSALYSLNAKPLGFKNGIENRYVSADYIVGKGVSCYGAINNFVRTFSDKNIAVNPEGVIYIPSGEVKFAVNPNRVTSVKKIIKRGNAVSRIDYKTGGEYNRHRISKALENKKIRRSRKLNLSSAPPFRKDGALKRIITSSARDYYSAQLVLDGVAVAQLYSPVVYEGLDGYVITSFKTTLSDMGERTTLSLVKPIELKEADYVA